MSNATCSAANPESGTLLIPGSGIGKNPDLGSGIIFPDQYFRELCVIFFALDPDPRPFWPWIRDEHHGWPPESSYLMQETKNQCSRSVVTGLWIRIRSFLHLLSRCQQKISPLFCVLLTVGTFTSVFKDASYEEVTNCRNYGFSKIFAYRWEGSGSLQTITDPDPGYPRTYGLLGTHGNTEQKKPKWRWLTCRLCCAEAQWPCAQRWVHCTGAGNRVPSWHLPFAG